MKQTSDRAVVTMAVGDSYVADFLAHTRPTWERYCAHHGVDLIVLTEPIDPAWQAGRKSVHWQKLLIGSLPRLRDYAMLAWMDADILINYRRAPSVFDAVRDGGIGVVDASDWFHRSDDTFNIHSRYLILNTFMKRKMGGALPKGVAKVTVTDGDLAAYYRFLGFEAGPDRMINTGLLVFSPAAHADFLAGVYARYDRDYMDFENTPLSYELQRSGRAEYIDPRFNVMWSAVAAEHYPFLFDPEVTAADPELLGRCANTAFCNAYFLHFAAGANNPIVKGAFDRIDADADGIVALTFPDLWESRDDFLELAALAGIDPAGRGIVF